MTIRTLDAVLLAEQLKALLLERSIPVQSLYLFGSAAKGRTHEQSDIDIAVVCLPFARDPLAEHVAVSQIAHSIDIRINIIYFRPVDFANKYSSVVKEIQLYGIPV